MNLRALAAADPDTPQRQRDCGAVPIGDAVQIRAKDASAYYAGLETCGNVWLCPVCSAKIHHRRVDELRDALTIWEAAGHAASLITITVPHDPGDRLATLVAAERAAWKQITAGGSWQRLKKRLGIAGHVIALEFTWGDANGWHPHYHVLLIHDRDLDAAAIATVHAHIHARLAAACRAHGLRPPGQVHAVRIDPNISATAAGAYLAKGGDWTPAEEMTRGDLKTSRVGSRTPFQILADYYQTGDTRDRDLWREHSRVTRGLAAVRWSRGLRTLILGPTAEPERGDGELAAEDVNGDLVAVIPLPTWSRIRLDGLEHAILVAAERGGPADVNALVARATNRRAKATITQGSLTDTCRPTNVGSCRLQQVKRP
jgi:hypothetical protein